MGALAAEQANEAALAVPSNSTPEPSANKGGRPSKPYWEDAMVEMFSRIYHDGFNPDTQAEVETAIAAWIAEKHRDEPSEASIRTRAAKVFKVHKREG